VAWASSWRSRLGPGTDDGGKPARRRSAQGGRRSNSAGSGQGRRRRARARARGPDRALNRRGGAPPWPGALAKVSDAGGGGLAREALAASRAQMGFGGPAGWAGRCELGLRARPNPVG
jgi:hypothetical protein